MKDCKTILFTAEITEVTEKGSSYEDSLYPNPDSNPDRTHVRFESAGCKKTIIEALYNTIEGSNFVHFSDSTLVDIGGSRLNLAVGEKINIYSDFHITN